MILTFIGMSSTKGLKLTFDTDTKEYQWYYGLAPTTILYMPTNKDLMRLEKELIKNGYMEVK